MSMFSYSKYKRNKVKCYISNIQMQYIWLSLLCTCTAIKSGGINKFCVPKPPLLGFVQFGIKSHSYFLLKNGALSAVPYICQAVFALVGGQLADILRAKKVCSTTAARRIFELTGKPCLRVLKVLLCIWIRVITKLPNSEQSYKGKVKTHNYINRQNQSTTGKLWKL